MADFDKNPNKLCMFARPMGPLLRKICNQQVILWGHMVAGQKIPKISILTTRPRKHFQK